MASIIPHSIINAGPPGTSHFTQIQGRRHNDAQSVNKLPAELLSHVFAIGQASERATRPRTRYYFGFQDVITSAISGGIPYHLVSLYLKRAGPTRPLEIDIEMRKRFWGAVCIEARDWETQLEKVPYLLKFLISRGATVDRWSSLTVCVKQPEVLYAIIGFINARPTCGLRFLSCRWKVRGYNSDIEELRSLDYPHLFSESYSFCASTVPRLRCVEFDAVPWGYVFNRSSPIFTGLTTLKLTSSYAYCSPENLRKLLVANPELENLSLEISKRAAYGFENEIGPPELDIFRVCLLRLRSLAFITGSFTSWMLCMIEMVQAPVLEKLVISGRFESSSGSMRLANHFAGTGAGGETSSGLATRSKSTYPLLDELDISKLSITPSGESLTDILSSLPTVTKLRIDGRHFTRELSKVPHTLPNLTHVYCFRVSYRQLGNVLRHRTSASFPLKFVYLNQEGFREAIGLRLPENLKYIQYHRPHYQIPIKMRAIPIAKEIKGETWRVIMTTLDPI
ncbi:hypothetical protein RhiXN_11498 [Rhizoctonia solani]|uniref:F-box domain-containing protein n=1 Tax=Rhizoctonia solani TaxID=456999 RepID=A0A8H8P2P3_9AGAM|nr:uncharacterized protein RhiXN_11498 [Rhizoctonia solani]QRW24586.1 hypothetical protein RhiXN_11498 [Rhizoctonia solani]